MAPNRISKEQRDLMWRRMCQDREWQTRKAREDRAYVNSCLLRARGAAADLPCPAIPLPAATRISRRQDSDHDAPTESQEREKSTTGGPKGKDAKSSTSYTSPLVETPQKKPRQTRTRWDTSAAALMATLPDKSPEQRIHKLAPPLPEDQVPAQREVLPNTAPPDIMFRALQTLRQCQEREKMMKEQQRQIDKERAQLKRKAEALEQEKAGLYRGEDAYFRYLPPDENAVIQSKGEDQPVDFHTTEEEEVWVFYQETKGRSPTRQEREKWVDEHLGQNTGRQAKGGEGTRALQTLPLFLPPVKRAGKPQASPAQTHVREVEEHPMGPRVHLTMSRPRPAEALGRAPDSNLDGEMGLDKTGGTLTSNKQQDCLTNVSEPAAQANVAGPVLHYTNSEHSYDMTTANVGCQTLPNIHKSTVPSGREPARKRLGPTPGPTTLVQEGTKGRHDGQCTQSQTNKAAQGPLQDNSASKTFNPNQTANELQVYNELCQSGIVPGPTVLLQEHSKAKQKAEKKRLSQRAYRARSKLRRLAQKGNTEEQKPAQDEPQEEPPNGESPLCE